MLQINNLSKTYCSKKSGKINALKCISVDFGERGLVFLTGKSGSGKSTLLNLIGGIDSATSGEIVICGRSSSSFSEEDFEDYRNSSVGFVFQDYNLIESYKAGENIGLALELQGKPAARSEIEALMQKVALCDEQGNSLYNRKINELSGGQKQRVAIARALIKDPKIILADEPTGALDSKTGAQLYELLKKLSKDKLVIVVSHDVENAKKYGDRIIELQDGCIKSDTLSAKNSYIAENVENMDFTRSKLPFKRSFVMGLSSLRHKKFRLVLSIILSTVTFIFFGFCLTAASVNEIDTELNTLFDSGQKTVSVRSHFFEYDEPTFSESQLDFIAGYNNNAVNIEFDSVYWLSSVRDRFGDGAYSTGNNPYVELGLASFRRFAELDPITGLEDANLRPDSRFVDRSLCQIPTKFDEIAITDLRADMFIRFGYREDDGTVSAIPTPDVLIGKKLGDFTITGVYETDQNINALKEYEGYDANSDEYVKAVFGMSVETIVSYGFVAKGFYLANSHKPNIGACLVKLSGNTAADAAFLDDLRYVDGERPVSIRTPYSALMNSIGFITQMLITPFMVMAAMFAVFAALLMLNFLTVSIDFNKRDIGILRAMGATRKNIQTICLSESLIIASIDFVLSLIGVFIVCHVLNSIYTLSVFVVGFFQIAMMFLLCFGVATIVTLLPIRRLTKKPPINIINNK